MNLLEAIKFLESKGHKVYPKGNSYSVWSPGQKNARVDCRYTARELIKFAQSRGQHKPMGHRGTWPVGPGGPNCPCCAPRMEDLKRFTKRRNRRNSLKDIE